MPLSEAVNKAVDFAINAKFLDGFFKEQRGAIMGDILTEFDQEAYDRHRREEGARNAKLETARLMKANNLPIADIVKYTGLSEEEISQL